MTATKIAFWIPVFMFLASCSAEPKALGSYIGSDDSGGFMLQISAVEDRNLRGSITVVSSNAEGETSAISRPVSGTMDDKLLNLNVENGTGLTLVSGLMTDRGVDLTLFSGETSQKLMLARSDAAEFAPVIERVRRRSAELKLASEQRVARASNLKRISADQDRISGFATEVRGGADNISRNMAYMEKVIGEYGRMALRNRQLRAQGAELVARNGDDNSRVSDMDSERERITDLFATHHESTLNALRELDAAVRARSQQAASMVAQCSAASELDCTGLLSAMNLYHRRADEFRRAAVRENAAYDTARSTI